VRKNLRIIHVSDARAAEAGLEKVRPGFEHTIRVDVPESRHHQATVILQILLGTDLFRSLDVTAAVDVLQVTTVRQYEPGQVICTKGTPGDSLRIIQSGTVSLDRDGISHELRYCDYFGEIALVADDAVHRGTATAATKVEMLEIAKVDAQYLMSRRPNLRERILRRADLNNVALAAIIANSVFASFSISQVTQLHSIMDEETVKANETVWRRGEIVKDVILVGEGQLHFKEMVGKDVDPFTQGCLLVDVFGLENQREHALNLVALTDSKIFRIDGDDLLDFLDNNPGAFIWMRDTLVVC
jgi:CRP-like cAMP-binding protein